MKESKESLVVIPARGGSQGIRRKNLISLAGIPLLSWTLRAARHATSVTRVMVSTEDEEIAALARSEGAEVPFVRPADLAGGEVHAVHTVLHALSWLADRENYIPDLVLMLLPTSPLRTARQIDEAIGLFCKSGAPSVISVTELEKQLLHLRTVENGILKPLVASDNFNVQRQELDVLYALNGSIYVSTPARLNLERTFHQKGAIPYVMPRSCSVDINEPLDLKLAEFFLALNQEQDSHGA